MTFPIASDECDQTYEYQLKIETVKVHNSNHYLTQ